jgi:hypothetical protein
MVLWDTEKCRASSAAVAVFLSRRRITISNSLLTCIRSPDFIIPPVKWQRNGRKRLTGGIIYFNMAKDVSVPINESTEMDI